jgi:hypothetical protein
MGFQITVFVDQPVTVKQTFIIQKLSQYHLLVDAVHGDDKEYLQKTFDNPTTRFFHFFDDLITCTTFKNLNYRPDFVMVCENKNEEEWTCIELFIDFLLCEERTETPQVTMGRELVPRIQHQAPLQQPVFETKGPEDLSYTIETKVVNDTLFVQIEKPFCDLPYTVVVFNFSQVGYKTVFTDLFICESWGVSKKDFQFLEFLWGKWEMEGEYNLDAMLKEATEACYPGEKKEPVPEPRVYRKPIQAVLETFQKIREGEVNPDPTWVQERYKRRHEQLANYSKRVRENNT